MRDGPGAVRSTRASEDRIPHLSYSPRLSSRWQWNGGGARVGPSTEAGAPGVSDTTREQSVNVGAGWATRGRWSRLSWAAVAFRSSGRGHEARAPTTRQSSAHAPPSRALAWPGRRATPQLINSSHSRLPPPPHHLLLAPVSTQKQ
jgi:hypothetical protein